MAFTKFKEEYAFMKLRDKCFKNAAECKGYIIKNFKDVDANSLYVRITNYQIKKYGKVLYTNSYMVKDKKFK